MSTKNVIITFLTKFDKKGLTKAEKELKGLDRTIAVTKKNMSIWTKTGIVAGIYLMGKFAKSSITAALAQEKLDKSLRLTLKSIGKEGLLPETKDFIANLQRATNVSENDLVPALQQLIAQTGNLDSSQYLLKTALDVSAGTGKDLSEVLDAINKAAIGSYKSIGTLGIGLTAADAQALGFVGVMQKLDKYTGSAEASTQSFEGQLKSFQISAGEATETLGTGFLTAASYIAVGSDNLRIFGIELENVSQGASDAVVGFGKVVAEKGWLKALNTTFEDLGREGFKVRQKQYLQAKGYLGLSQQTIDALELQNKYGKKQLTYDETLRKIQADILAKNKATSKEKALQNELADKRAKIESMFDLDKINLQAALTRKLTAEDELRVRTLLKLQENTAAATDEAQKYLDVLQVISDGKIETSEIEMLAKKWGMTVPAVLLYLKALFDSNAELQKMLGLLDQVRSRSGGLGAGQVNASQLLYGLGVDPSQVSNGTIKSGGFTGIMDLITPVNNPAFGTTADAKALGLALGFTPMASGGIVDQPTFAMIGEQGAEAVIPLDKMGAMGNQLTVNVAGSVISEGQLASVIQDALYSLNRTGAVSQLANLGR